jgi:hypothetical protein
VRLVVGAGAGARPNIRLVRGVRGEKEWEKERWSSTDLTRREDLSLESLTPCSLRVIGEVYLYPETT